MHPQFDIVQKDRVAAARSRIVSGDYEAPGVLDAILSTRVVDRVLDELSAVPVGDGQAYRDLVDQLDRIQVHQLLG